MRCLNSQRRFSEASTPPTFRKLLVGLIFLYGVVSDAKAETLWRGVNIAGAEFAADRLPGRVNFDYHYPSTEELVDAARAGSNIIRLPFLWERLQPVLGEPFNEAESKNLEAAVRSARALNLAVVLDPHDYGAFKGKLIGSNEVPEAMFVEFWRQLVRLFPKDEGVIFGLMNEPNRQSARDWAKIAQAVVLGIRDEGSTQWILVPGSYWTGAHSWTASFGGSSNADAFRHFVDPANRTVFEMHQYFDSDSSGTHRTCVGPDVGVERLKEAEAWLKAVKQRGFVGEFGASSDPVCLEALRRFLNQLESNEVWAGWTYWAASLWFGDYMFNAFPADKREQGRVLREFLAGRARQQ
jgi:endoglucanase